MNSSKQQSLCIRKIQCVAPLKIWSSQRIHYGGDANILHRKGLFTSVRTSICQSFWTCLSSLVTSASRLPPAFFFPLLSYRERPVPRSRLHTALSERRTAKKLSSFLLLCAELLQWVRVVCSNLASSRDGIERDKVLALVTHTHTSTWAIRKPRAIVSEKIGSRGQTTKKLPCYLRKSMNSVINVNKL